MFRPSEQGYFVGGYICGKAMAERSLGVVFIKTVICGASCFSLKRRGYF